MSRRFLKFLAKLRSRNRRQSTPVANGNWSIAALTTRLIAFPVMDDREHIECFIGISHNLQLLHHVRRQGDRERNAAFLSMRPAHADRCRNPRVKRVRLHGCTIALRLPARSHRYGSCEYRHVLQVPARDTPSSASSWFS